MAQDGRRSIRQHFPSLPFVGALAIVLALGAAAFIYLGVYNIAADEPHTPAVYSMLERLRDRSIEARARGITPPADLASAQRVSVGAGLYGEMCSGCHLGPGVEKSEMSQGLYPQAPELARAQDLTPAQQFWIIKHGVKLSAMPAWGKTHPDPLIWNMVAFVRKLPGMTPEQYKALVASAPADHPTRCPLRRCARSSGPASGTGAPSTRRARAHGRLAREWRPSLRGAARSIGAAHPRRGSAHPIAESETTWAETANPPRCRPLKKPGRDWWRAACKIVIPEPVS